MSRKGTKMGLGEFLTENNSNVRAAPINAGGLEHLPRGPRERTDDDNGGFRGGRGGGRDDRREREPMRADGSDRWRGDREQPRGGGGYQDDRPRRDERAFEERPSHMRLNLTRRGEESAPPASGGFRSSDRFASASDDKFSRAFSSRGGGDDRREPSRFGDRDGGRFNDGPRFGDRDGGRFGDRDGGRFGDRDGGAPRYNDRDGGRPRFGDREGGGRFNDGPRFGDRDGGRFNNDGPRYNDRDGGRYGSDRRYDDDRSASRVTSAFERQTLDDQPDPAEVARLKKEEEKAARDAEKKRKEAEKKEAKRLAEEAAVVAAEEKKAALAAAADKAAKDRSVVQTVLATGKKGKELAKAAKTTLKGVTAAVVLAEVVEHNKESAITSSKWLTPDEYGSLLEVTVGAAPAKEQLQALYALQLFMHEHRGREGNRTKGMMELAFKALYAFDIVSDEAFIEYKYDTEDSTAGKMQAIIETSEWLSWLESYEASDDDEEEEDE
ncbi:hypothetical protein H257_00015 [Aphanomyces astaci]|uniref:W2 domain-containing protein n=1 Tax=Aphanomyces astaci TaxID=112090 RepID=W4HB82_APHAT|nr:hypothetical protein H257_00015 [Aphanomyces astaci]ETV88378.1 hypothetical protein H257_00015 [Aphanomyces astaci]RQM28134.1 hypothetical protein B5M09_007191 [Aphanomyces astaci]|eukprot:XP_009820778.1 hypothetical protein H257_00015 [Aphanomyces astaci]